MPWMLLSWHWMILLRHWCSGLKGFEPAYDFFRTCGNVKCHFHYPLPFSGGQLPEYGIHLLYPSEQPIWLIWIIGLEVLLVGVWPIGLPLIWQQLVQVFLFMALDPFEHVLEPFELIDAVLFRTCQWLRSSLPPFGSPQKDMPSFRA